MGTKEKNMIDAIFNHQTNKQEKNKEIENVSLIIDEWLKPNHVKYKTRYTPSQIKAISIFQSLSKKYNIKTLKRFLSEYRIAKLSENGESAKELKEILIARMPKDDDSNIEKITKFLE